MECEPTSHGAPSASWGRTQPVLRELKVPTPRMDPIGHTARARTPKKCPKSPRWTVVGSIHHLTITDFRASSPPGGRRRSRTANVTARPFYQHRTSKPCALAVDGAISRRSHERRPSADPAISRHQPRVAQILRTHKEGAPDARRRPRVPIGQPRGPRRDGCFPRAGPGEVARAAIRPAR